MTSGDPDGGVRHDGAAQDGAAQDGAAQDGREARSGGRRGRRVADVVASVVLLVVGALAALTAGWGIMLLALGFGSCDAPGNRCDEGLGGTVVTLGPVLVALVFLVAAVVCVLRLVRRRTAWPVALLGLGLVVVVFLVARLVVGGTVTIGI
ncbi:DUF6264 family protein [Curtobacterium sp. MCBD17_023]|uniref:DUF6264 family protein n=1 Tax=Curtobacterium sp. MCBD17_023 TaxID=2175657 RepID=UPI000D9E4F66|nr:hypothetical protein DEI84_14885 [Curtobacterium sp. MCBD17_023]